MHRKSLKLRFTAQLKYRYVREFTSDHFYLEMTDHGIFVTFADTIIAEELLSKISKYDLHNPIHFTDCKLNVSSVVATLNLKAKSRAENPDWPDRFSGITWKFTPK